MKTNVTGINKASRKGLLGEIFSITITQISVIISTSNEERKKIRKLFYCSVPANNQ